MGKPLNWEPIRKGPIYCAPACGANCLFARYEEAVRLSDRLCRRLGAGWKPRVWENMGWHWSVSLGSATVYPAHISKYSADLHVARQFLAYDDDPRKAVLKAIAMCDRAMEMWKLERESLAGFR